MPHHAPQPHTPNHPSTTHFTPDHIAERGRDMLRIAQQHVTHAPIEAVIAFDLRFLTQYQHDGAYAWLATPHGTHLCPLNHDYSTYYLTLSEAFEHLRPYRLTPHALEPSSWRELTNELPRRTS